MKTIGIVGAGTMGAGIAHVAAISGCRVFLHDISDEVLTKALERIETELQKGVEKTKITAEQASGARSNIQPTSTFNDFSNCEVVIEAALEDLEIKRDIFRELETACTPETIFASNTSSLSITAIAASIKSTARVVGLHFFNPPHLMKLVEVIRGNETSEHTMQRSAELVSQFGKTPVVVKDTPGFIVNRIARPFYGEALRLLGEGVASVEEIDRIVRLEGGFKMGPFELMDLIGIDVNFAVTRSMYEQTFGEPRYRPHLIQQTMVNAGMLGRKTKRGFYDYSQ
ncbi:MAG: 3-hydroxybutyryl-CoA dehydrogenase [Ignavibacteria bacterium]|nr:3-hydroxybutyryl-CoA dehydrogenase [Ignavibacteria bacterium]